MDIWICDINTHSTAGLVWKYKLKWSQFQIIELLDNIIELLDLLLHPAVQLSFLAASTPAAKLWIRTSNTLLLVLSLYRINPDQILGISCFLAMGWYRLASIFLPHFIRGLLSIMLFILDVIYYTFIASMMGKSLFCLWILWARFLLWSIGLDRVNHHPQFACLSLLLPRSPWRIWASELVFVFDLEL